ncbi:hypothetical protein M3J09_006314 [Ascochyta lentis]
MQHAKSSHWLIVIDPQTERERVGIRGLYTVAAFASAQLRVVKPDHTNQHACYL